MTVRNKIVAAKTGTSNNYRDAWTVGYTPSVVTAVWAGNNDNREMNRGGGSTAAAPIWDAFMEKYLTDKPNETFTRPASLAEATVDFLSSKKPTSASGQLITDLFAPWQLPKDDDDVHTRIKVCRSNGLLITDATPVSEVEERIFTQVHSEQPKNPAWENPVLNWARSQSIQSDPPTAKCDITIQDPDIEITEPGNNTTVTGVFSVATTVALPPGTTGTVDFAIDNDFYSSDTSEPYSATVDSSSLTAGGHTLTVTINASNGTSATASIAVTVTHPADTTPPGNVTNVNVTPLTGGRATVTWKNPSDTDLASVTFYASQTNGVRGAKLSTVTANHNASQSETISGLVTGTTNYITIVTTDSSGNSNNPGQQYLVVPL